MNIKISDAITLAKRKNTSNWQAVIKAPDGKWRRISTKTNDEQQATVFTWRDDADRYIVKYKRDVLRLYVYFLVATGMRPGTELNNIKWSNFQHVQKGKSGKSYYRLFVMEGKKQGRVAPDQIKQSTRTVMVSEEAYEFIVPFGHYDEPEILPYAIRLICPIGADVRQLGERFIGRMGGAVSTHAGLNDLVGETPQEYVQKAAALAADLARLKDLRATLRDRIGASPLCDGPSFANNMEKAFQDMWDSRLPDG